MTSPAVRRRAVALLVLAIAAGVGASPLHGRPATVRRLAGAQAAPLGMDNARRVGQLRVLAFGDSLTEGWIASTQEKKPYGWQLGEMLKQRLRPKGVQVDLTISGTGKAGVLDRLEGVWYSQLKAARDAGKPYQYIIFMAGINDIILQKRTPDAILKRMNEMWDAAIRDGSTVVVIPTLPTNSWDDEARRRELAQKIREEVGRRQRGGDLSLQLVDLEGDFNWWGMDPAQRSRVFDDGVHFTDYGYQQLLAGRIFGGLVKILGL